MKGDLSAPESPALSESRRDEISIAPVTPEPRRGDIAFRMISNFAAENLRHAADALEAGMPNLARHHATKALEQIDHIDRL